MMGGRWESEAGRLGDLRESKLHPDSAPEDKAFG